MNTADQAVTALGFDTTWYRHGHSDNEAILCLHSLGLDGSSFNGVARLLASNRTIVSFDQRGHGAASGCSPHSFAELVSDAANALGTIGAKQVHIVGHSMGAAVAATLASWHPQITSLTVIASPPTGLPAFIDRAVAQQVGMDEVIEVTLQRWFSDAPVDERARNSLSNMTPEGFDASWKALAQFQGYAIIAASLPPTLCLSFAQDLSTPPAVHTDIATTINSEGSTAHHISLPGAGHMGLLTQSERVAAELNLFLDKRVPHIKEDMAHG